MKFYKLATTFLSAFSVTLFPLCVFADPHPAGLKSHRFNGPTNPFTSNSITTFEIVARECSDVPYKNGTSESDCRNGNVRSVITGDFTERLGQRVEYKFDIRAREPISYKSWNNSHAIGHLPAAQDSRLHIAQWQGPANKSFIYMLKLDGTRGVTFLGQPCFSIEELKGWNTFSLKTKWANDDKGWVVVKCNDDIVYFKDGVPTNRPDFCFITNECTPGQTINPKKIQFALGPVMKGFGPEWKQYSKPSPFTDFPKPIRFEVRDVSINKGVSLYGPEERALVARLQDHLKKLECDPGPVDGLMGAKTRDAALTCRTFSAGQLPETIGFRTIRDVVTAYETNFPVPEQ